MYKLIDYSANACAAVFLHLPKVVMISNLYYLSSMYVPEYVVFKTYTPKKVPPAFASLFLGKTGRLSTTTNSLQNSFWYILRACPTFYRITQLWNLQIYTYSIHMCQVPFGMHIH